MSKNTHTKLFKLQFSATSGSNFTGVIKSKNRIIFKAFVLFWAEAFFAYLIRFSSSCNIKCVDCKIDKNLTEFSLTHTTTYNIIKANTPLIKEVT